MQPDKQTNTREAEQGHESLLWVVSRGLKLSDEGMFSRKRTLKRTHWTSPFGQKQTPSLHKDFNYSQLRLVRWGWLLVTV